MNTTGNYQLNQWEASDRILRLEFNADNSKIDAALKANADAAAEAASAAASAAPFHLIRDITVPSSVMQIDIDVTDMDWSRWQAIHIDCMLDCGGGVSLLANGSTNPYFSRFYSIDSNTNVGGCLCKGLSYWNEAARYAHRATLPVGRQGARRVVCQVAHGVFGSADTNYQSLTSLNLLSGNTDYAIQAGGRVLIWGEG